MSGDCNESAVPRDVPTPWHLSMDIRPVRSKDARALTVLFDALDKTFFRPHDMGVEGARSVAEHHGQDVYVLGWQGRIPVAYGMLRGWDEGYSVPSLGIAVREGYRNRGLGRIMMTALHDMARASGAHIVRLRVAPGNVGARHLYDTLGYQAVGLERGEVLMFLDLDAEVPTKPTPDGSGIERQGVVASRTAPRP